MNQNIVLRRSFAFQDLKATDIYWEFQLWFNESFQNLGQILLYKIINLLLSFSKMLEQNWVDLGLQISSH